MPTSVKTVLATTLLLFKTLVLAHPIFSQPVFDSFIERMLRKNPSRFAEILERRDEYDVQILYTKIDRDKKDQPYFTTYRYRADPGRYFYPAGTIKLAAAVLALEKINNLKIAGLDKNTTMMTLADRPSQTEAISDSTASDGLPSVAHYIRKLLLASDNDAYNRLYEFLGQEYFNETMQAKGYSTFRATNRIGTSVSFEENRYTNPVKFIDSNKEKVYEQAGQYSQKNFAASEPILRGRGYIKEGVLVNQPMDFREMNAFGLADQQLFLRNLMFPGRASENQVVNLTKEDYRFLYQYMSQLPIETEFPSHYNDIMEDASVKYLLFGKTKKRTPRQIRSFNKTGEAYGYLIDNAYIADFEMGVEFLLSAVIYCNKDQVLNDHTYEYETVGYKFMADLGKTILEYELARKRGQRPGLEIFEMEYDK